MPGYVKIFSAILQSTIWRETAPTKVVWITMLALADRDGFVGASVPGLADTAKVTLQECLDALKVLESPDEWSRTRTDEDQGRRIEKVDGGWHIINYQKYREMQSRAAANEKAARRQAAWRERRKLRNNAVTSTVTPVTENNPIASASASAVTTTPLTPQHELPPVTAPPRRARIGPGHPAFEAVQHWTQITWPEISTARCPEVETHQAQSLAALSAQFTPHVVMDAMDRAAADPWWANKLDLQTFLAQFARFLPHDRAPSEKAKGMATPSIDWNSPEAGKL